MSTAGAASLAEAPPPVHDSRTTPLLVGFGGGFAGGLTAMPGALVTIWCDLNGRSKQHQRGIAQPFILSMQLTSLAAMATYPAYFNGDLLGRVALCLPAVLLGTWAGLLFGRVSNASFRFGVLTIILFSGLVLVAR